MMYMLIAASVGPFIQVNIINVMSPRCQLHNDLVDARHVKQFIGIIMSGVLNFCGH